MKELNNYDLLIGKLDQFIRKYYINQLLRGLLFSVGIVLALFILTALAENYFFHNWNTGSATTPRQVLFFSFLGIGGGTIVWFVLVPLFKYFKLGSVISHEKAADIVGNHFGEVKDKLLNVLQLKKQVLSFGQTSLIEASINQKIDDLKPVSFPSAIDLQKNRKYLRVALPPLLLLILLLYSFDFIENGTSRLIRSGVDHEKPAPFSFVIDANQLSVIQFEDFDLTIQVEGEEMPNEAFIEVDNFTYKLSKSAPNQFSYTFSKVGKDTDFRLFGGGVESKGYQLDVLEKPNIVGFEMRLDYPAYVGRKDEVIQNIGDAVVPAGTKIDWAFSSLNTSEMAIQFNTEKAILADRLDQELFSVNKRIVKDLIYQVLVSNENLNNADSVAYSVSVIPDLYPTIKVERFQDSLDNKVIYFAGEAGDDYGLRTLSFNYQIENNGKQGALNKVELAAPAGKQAGFDHMLDLVKLNLKPGDKLSYYFEVFDNDGVNGSKSSRTQLMAYEVPTLDEIEAKEEQNSEEIKDDLKKAIEKSQDLKEQAKELREEMIQKKELDWQDRKKIENLLQQQKELEQQIEDAKENFEENLQNQEEFKETKEEIIEKQEKLEELFEELMDDETKELFRKLEELMQELNREEIMEQLDNIEMDDEEVEMELDRMLELYKQMEFEKEMQEAISKLDSLAKDLDELSEDTKEEKKSDEELKEEQERINEEFEKVKEQLENAEKKNEELESPNEMGDMEDQKESIQQDLNQSMDQLQQQKKSGASKKQKSGSEKMKEMAKQMQSMMGGAQMEQMQEDMKALRQLLENLVNMSYDQEDLIKDVEQTQPNTPNYKKLVQTQYKLKDDFVLIEDSLHALSKRVFQIESFVTEKVADVKKSLKKSLTDLEERKKRSATAFQQFTMTGTNDLALMLSEVMEQMQQQMAQQMQGNQMCQKPGQGKPGQGKMPMKGMGNMQQQLNDMMKNMQQQLKDGKKPGGKGPGSKEFAKMAAKQAALRKALQQMQKDRQQQGKGQSKELQEIIEKMDQTEEELVNKKLSRETLKRQEDIKTRLLEHEKAERERGFDEKRKAEKALERDRKMPPELEEYLKKREAQIELFKTVSPTLKPYYKSIVEEYFNSLKN